MNFHEIYWGIQPRFLEEIEIFVKNGHFIQRSTYVFIGILSIIRYTFTKAKTFRIRVVEKSVMKQIFYVQRSFQ
jgi:hypothetical protein